MKGPISESDEGGSPSLSTISTPAAIVDQGVLRANLDRMNRRAENLGVALRPHFKTTKSAAVADQAARHPVVGWTVSTLKEAACLLENGYRNLFYAVTIEPGKFERAARLLRNGAELILTCDNLTVAEQLAEFGCSSGLEFSVLIEINCGENRSGLFPDEQRVVDLAEILTRCKGVSLAGVCTHGGHSYLGRNAADHIATAESERGAAVQAAEAIRTAGYSCPIVSVGSSPTAVHAEHMRGVTELRCGVYMFGDLFQAGIGMCGLDDLALSVVTAIIGHRPEDNVLLVDAGALALSKDLSTAKLSPEQRVGFGRVSSLAGDWLPSFTVASVHQEHGQITAPTAIDFSQFPIGTRLRIWPNHACMTAAAYDFYHIVAGSETVLTTWKRIHGW